MGHLLTHIIVFLCSAVTTAIFMPWLLSLCHKFELTYESNDSHHFRIPRVGGMILAPAAAVGLAISIVLRQHFGTITDTFKSSSIFIGLGVLLIYLFGVIDDIFGLNRWQKRLLLFATSLAFPIFNLYINNLDGFIGINEIGASAGFILTVIVTLLIMKGISCVNDSDGLSGSISLIPLSILGVIFFVNGCYGYSTMAAAIAGALVIYLYYNIFGDKRIGTKTYMGHAGALFMSYGIIYLSLKYAMVNPVVNNNYTDGLLLPYSMLIIPMFEYIRVWVLSTWNGLNKKERRAHHIQHKLAAKGYSQKIVMMIILAIDILFVAINESLFYFFDLNITWIVMLDIILYTAWQFVTKYQTEITPQTVVAKTEFPDYKGIDDLVSVIMPTWNSSTYVASSIKSVLAQTYKNWELIITDDCSSDNTMDIIHGFAEKDSRIVILQNEKNGGAGVARNNSIIHARGRYIAFCDSDDRWTEDKLEKQLEFMKSKDVALCFAPYYSCDGRDQYLGYISAPRRVTLFQMMCDNKIGFLTAMYDTKKLGKHPIPRQRKRQDHALLLNLLKICHYAYSVPEPLAHYRIHADNLSGKKISLLKYNAHTYAEVFGWPMPLCWLFLFTFFLPTYFTKKLKNIFINIIRSI